MFKCNDCGEIFFDPAEYTEKVGEFWGSPAYATFQQCPFCNSDDFSEYEEGEEE